MARLFSILLVVVLAGGMFPSATHANGAEAVVSPARAKVGLSEYELTVGGVQRGYHLFIPRSARQAGPRPLIVAFHGGGGRALGFAKRTKLRDLADRYGAVIALPQGLSNGGRGGSWNTQSLTPVGYADKAQVQDLAFVDTMISQISQEAPIASNQIFAMGLSKGGMMAYHLACERPNLLVGVAVVAGTLASGKCRNAGRTDVLHIHGSADENVPFDGGRGIYTNPQANWPAVEDSLDQIFRSASCPAKPKEITLTRDTKCEVSACGGGRDRMLCIVDEGGHGWPGTEPAAWQVKRDQYISPLFDATAYIGQFFFERQ